MDVSVALGSPWLAVSNGAAHELRRETTLSRGELRLGVNLVSYSTLWFLNRSNPTDPRKSPLLLFTSLSLSLPVRPSQFSSPLVPLSTSDRESFLGRQAYWEVPGEVLTEHVRMAVHELSAEFGSKEFPLLDNGAQTMLGHQHPRVGFAAVNHMASILRGWGKGITHPSSWLVRHIKELQTSMGLPATSGGKPLPPRNSGSSSSASGSRGPRASSRSRSSTRERDVSGERARNFC